MPRRYELEISIPATERQKRQHLQAARKEVSMPSLLTLPKWAREKIERLQHDLDRNNRRAAQDAAKIEKQSEDIQCLLDVVRNVRPDLFDKWNNGTSLKELVEASKVQAARKE